MEITKTEVTAIIAAVFEVEKVVRELNELELTMIGGGVGEVILA